MKLSMLPQEILERIAYFAGGYTMSVLGMDSCNNHLLRNGMFLSGGPGKALSEILSLGGDSRALLTIRKIIPADLAIAKAVATKNPRILARVFAIWDSCQSHTGLYLSLGEDFRFGLDNILCDPDKRVVITRYCNALLIQKGQLDRIDETIPNPYWGYLYGNLDIPMTKPIYDKLFPYITNYRMKLRMISLVGSIEEVLFMLQERRWDEDDIIYAMEYAPRDIVIAVYNRYGSGKDNMYDIEEIIVDLCERISTLEDLNGIENKLESNGYTQATRYFSESPGYIHYRLVGPAIDTHRYIALDNIIRYAEEGDDMYIVKTMVDKGWTLDMILDKISVERITSANTSAWLSGEAKVELVKRGILQLEDILDNRTLYANALRSLDHDSALFVIRNREIQLCNTDDMLWIWREFGIEMSISRDNVDLDDPTPIPEISRGLWICHGEYTWKFAISSMKISQRIMDLYLCWTSYNYL